MRVVLTKHTTTQWNLDGRMQGHINQPICGQGRVEALKLGRELVELGIELIVTSDLIRAVQTAEILNTFLHVPLGLDPRLRECTFGKIEGMTKAEAAEAFGPELVTHWNDSRLAYDFRPYGGEERNGVLKRHLEALEDARSKHVDAKVLFMGHGRGTSTLLTHLGHDAEMQRGEFREFDF